MDSTDRGPKGLFQTQREHSALDEMRRKTNNGTADRRHLGVDTDQTRTKTRKRRVIASFRVAESMDFKGDFRQWKHLFASGR